MQSFLLALRLVVSLSNVWNGTPLLLRLTVRSIDFDWYVFAAVETCGRIVTLKTRQSLLKFGAFILAAKRSYSPPQQEISPLGS